MEIAAIKAKVAASQYVYSQHADIERNADGLTFAQVEEALLAGRIIEDYPDTGRGETCLVAGKSKGTPVHSVCGWRGEKLVLITVYVPRPPKFSDPWTRAVRKGK